MWAAYPIRKVLVW